MGNKINLNFYTITSNFNDILIKLCNKIVNSDDCFLINFDKKESKLEADKLLWTKEKNNFLPHKVYGENISKRDKIVLFDGSYDKLNPLKKFNSLIISPCVRIRKFSLFRKFLVFSYAKNNLFNANIRDKLENNNFIINWYNEYSPFKWKQL